MREQVGGCHRDTKTSVAQALLEGCDDAVLLRDGLAKSEEVMVVEVDAVDAEVCELVQHRQRVITRASWLAKRVASVVLQRPETKCKPIRLLWGIERHRWNP